MSLDLSSSNHLAILPWLGAPARELVQRLLMFERRPRTALTERQEMSSAITFDRVSSLDTSIRTSSLRAAFLVRVQVLGPTL